MHTYIDKIYLFIFIITSTESFINVRLPGGIGGWRSLLPPPVPAAARTRHPADGRCACAARRPPRPRVLAVSDYELSDTVAHI